MVIDINFSGWRSLAAVCIVLAVTTQCQWGAAGQPLDAQIESTVGKSIPYLKREGVAWMEKRGCVSCHQIPFMLWSLSEAQAHGFSIDSEKLRQWQRWSTKARNFVKPAQKDDQVEAKTLAANIDTMSALLLAVKDEAGSSWRSQFSDSLIANQKPDGTWQSCGQLPAQKRSKDETTRVTVAWTLLALAREGREAKDYQAAMDFIDEQESAVSTEYWVTRYLLAQQLDQQQADTLRQEIVRRQQEDGGWGWLSEDSSDALATGMALYALKAHDSDDDPKVEDAARRAIEFLTSTQNENGSWDVPGTKKSTRGKSTPTSSYWGTAWAVIGMLQAK